MNRDAGAISRRAMIKLSAVLVIAVVIILIVVHFTKDPVTENTPAAATPTQTVPNGPAVSELPSPIGTAPSADDFLNGIPVVKAPDDKKPFIDTHLDAGIRQGPPSIDHLSSTKFGNGENITVYGTNFTEDNTILLSIEFSDSYTGISSVTGTSLRFTAALSLSKELEASFSKMAPDVHDRMLKKLIEKHAVKSPYKDGWYLNARLSVQNRNGTSNSIPVLVNVLAGI